jgi:hypothetical protein
MTTPLRNLSDYSAAEYQYPALILISALEHDKLYLPNTLKRLLTPHCKDAEAFFEQCLQSKLIEENAGQYGVSYKLWQAYQPAPGSSFTQVPDTDKCGTDMYGTPASIDLNGNVVYLETQDKIRDFHNLYSHDQLAASEVLSSIVDTRIKLIPFQSGHILDREISIFRAPASNKFGKLTTIRDVLFKEIRSDKHLPVTRILRNKPTTTLQEIATAREYKQLAFDYVTWSCVCSYHHDSHVTSYSGIVCLDLDHLEAIVDIQRLINADPAVIASFISPSGNGLKVLYETNSTRTNEQWYKAYSKRLLKLTGLPETYVDPIDGREKKHIDPTCSNISRACFLPCDASLYVNPVLL